MKLCGCLCAHSHPDQPVQCDKNKPAATLIVISAVLGRVPIDVCWPCYHARKKD